MNEEERAVFKARLRKAVGNYKASRVDARLLKYLNL
jgi:hypothetical protein